MARHGGERLRIERVLPAGTGKAGAHYHLDFDQRFDVLAGTATMTVEGERRTVGAGESVELARPTKHADPCNEGPAELTVRLTIERCRASSRSTLRPGRRDSLAGS